MGSVLAYFKMCSTFFNSIISEGLQAFFLLLYVHKYCLIILDLDRICWHICLLPFLKLLGFFFKTADESFSVMRDFDFEASTWIGLFFVLFFFF